MQEVAPAPIAVKTPKVEKAAPKKVVEKDTLPLLDIPRQQSPPAPAAATAVLGKPILDPPQPDNRPVDEPTAPPAAPATTAGDAWNVATTAVNGKRPPDTGVAKATDSDGAASQPDATATSQLPAAYSLRLAPNHAKIAQGRGGSPETEAAVQAALLWLTENQSADGHWSARQHEAGRATTIDGRDRRNAGIEADSAMTGLALLALLASGHTHRDGAHAQNVQSGLEYLLSVQAADGNMAGGADAFARMYSHAIGTFALSEAYGMTGDVRLRDAVRRAIAYTIAAQDAGGGGGWRYRPGDPGDTSQLGWQLMALKSAELAGIPIPDATRQGIVRYLQSVATGTYGGLASYRPNEQVTCTMTAEALVCWQFLGLAREHPANNEAGDFLLGQLPGPGTVNVYYWYYGTLATFQLQGDYWRRWNAALRTQLLATQHKSGPLAGTWDPDAAWGGYGGRIYSTSLSTLCLEVYYRFLPLYVQAASDKAQAK
jgi:hypothetical protein